jgi:hypothetical protein
MTPDQKRLVRETWKQVAPMADAAADLFYRRLFEIDPTTRELFRATDMRSAYGHTSCGGISERAAALRMTVDSNPYTSVHADDTAGVHARPRRRSSVHNSAARIESYCASVTP